MDLSLSDSCLMIFGAATKKVMTAISISEEIIVLQSATRRNIFQLSNQCILPTNYSTSRITEWDWMITSNHLSKDNETVM